MTARGDLEFRLTNGAGLSPEWAQRQIDAFRAEVLREAAAKIRRAPHDGTGDTWPWWDAADIPGLCADLIDPDKELS